MKLDKVRKMAASILGVGENRVWMNPEQTDRIMEVITKEDARVLIREGIIKKRKPTEQSRGRTRLLLVKKRKGRKKGPGKRTGKKSARSEQRKHWIANVRAQRRVLRELTEKHPEAVKKIGHSKLYKRIKGNYFKGKKYVEAMIAEKVGK